MAELKPCPFCGEVPTMELFIDLYHRKKFGIECRNEDCDIQPMTAWYADEKDCVKDWNRRAEDGK